MKAIRGPYEWFCTAVLAVAGALALIAAWAGLLVPISRWSEKQIIDLCGEIAAWTYLPGLFLLGIWGLR